MVRRGGYYYLFFSGDNCCGPNAHYAVMVARSRSATGPFEVPPGDIAGGVILALRGIWVAPGHNAVIEDARGTHWMLYHAVDAAARPPGRRTTAAGMMLDRIAGAMVARLEGDGPSSGPGQDQLDELGGLGAKRNRVVGAREGVVAPVSGKKAGKKSCGSSRVGRDRSVTGAHQLGVD